jgi:hypothetical protein
MTLFSFTRFCLRVLADLNEIIRRLKRNVILTIAIMSYFKINAVFKIGNIFLLEWVIDVAFSVRWYM